MRDPNTFSSRKQKIQRSIFSPQRGQSFYHMEPDYMLIIIITIISYYMLILCLVLSIFHCQLLRLLIDILNCLKILRTVYCSYTYSHHTSYFSYFIILFTSSKKSKETNFTLDTMYSLTLYIQHRANFAIISFSTTIYTKFVGVFKNKTFFQ